MEDSSAAPLPLVSRVKIRNYRSIKSCDVKLANLTFVVGRNGAGKSNFLDAISFVSESLRESLPQAIAARSPWKHESEGAHPIRRKATGHPRAIAIELCVALPNLTTATYGFEIGSKPGRNFFVQRELLVIRDGDGDVTHSFSVAGGQIQSSSETAVLPQVVDDRLFLVVAAGLAAFRPAYDALISMGFYNFDVENMRLPRRPDSGELLQRNGGNIASVLGRLSSLRPADKERIESYLSRIVPGVVGVDRARIGTMETLEFKQLVDTDRPWKFLAADMSDGTLRALATLVATTQFFKLNEHIRFVGIEEPESSLHPAASRALAAALSEAAEQTQILVTTHSTDLLSAMELPPERLLVVESAGGDSKIGSLDRASIDAIRKHLYNPAELLRMDQLEPDAGDIARQEQMRLFESEP
jgi:predicted ATPase